MRFLLLALALAASHATLVLAYSMVPRWGAAVAVLPHPPTVVIQGGKTDASGEHSYSSAPNSGDTIILPLSKTFPASSPPYQLLTPGPTYAWHCLAPLFSKDGAWTLLSFGGHGGWSSPANDARSAWLLTPNPSTGTANYTQPEEGWGGQPTRRVRHACAAPVTGGKVFITGGQEPDFRETFAHTFVFDPASMRFTGLAPLPVAMYGHSSVLLANGTLLVIGGMTSRAGATALQPLDIVYALDTTTRAPAWTSVRVPNPPKARHGASAILNNDGSVFIFGGADVEGKPLNDGWILDPEHLSWTQTFNGGSVVPGRQAQMGATAGGGQVIVVGGYGASAPVRPDTLIINSKAAAVGTQGSGSGTDTTPVGNSAAGSNSDTSAGTGGDDAGVESDTAAGSDHEDGSNTPPTSVINGSSDQETPPSSTPTSTATDPSPGSDTPASNTLPEYSPAPITNNPANDAPGGYPNSADGNHPSTLTAGTGVVAPTPTTTEISQPIGAAPSVKPLTLGLTVGLLGGMLFIGLGALLWWCLRRRREKEEEQLSLIQDDMEKGAWEKEAMFNTRDAPPPQRQKSILQRFGSKMWRGQEYTRVGRRREATIIPAMTRDHFQPDTPLPFSTNPLPHPPKPYHPDDIVFGSEGDLGVREGVPSCFTRGPRGSAAVVAGAVTSLASRPSNRRQQTAELSNITPFPYTTPPVLPKERSKESFGDLYESDAHFSDAYDADESSAGHRMLGDRPVPSTITATLAPPAVYPPLSAHSSLSSARSAVALASTSEAARGVPAVAQLVGLGVSSGPARSTSKRFSARKDTAPWEAWDPRSDTESSAYHFPIPPPKMGTTVYDPQGTRLDSAIHARTYSDPFADSEDDAPLLSPPKPSPVRSPRALPVPPQSTVSPKPLPLPPINYIRPQPVSVKTVPSARDSSQDAERVIARPKLPPAPLSPRLPPPPKPPQFAAVQLGAELEAHRCSAVGSMRSAASHSSVFAALSSADLDLSFDFTPPVVESRRPSPPASPSPSSRALPPTPHFQVSQLTGPVEDEPLLDTLPPPALLFSSPRQVNSEKELPPWPESLPPVSSSQVPPRISTSPPRTDSPPAVTAPLRVRSRSRPTPGYHSDMASRSSSGVSAVPGSSSEATPGSSSEAISGSSNETTAVFGSTRVVSPSESDVPSLAALDRVLDCLSPSTTGASGTSNASLERFKRAFPPLSPVCTGASTGSAAGAGKAQVAPSPLPSPAPVLSVSTRSGGGKQPLTPSRAATLPPPRPAHTAPTTPVRQPVRQGSLASFPSKASLRPGQEGYVSTIVSNINLRDTPESVRSARRSESDGSVISRYQ